MGTRAQTDDTSIQRPEYATTVIGNGRPSKGEHFRLEYPCLALELRWSIPEAVQLSPPGVHVYASKRGPGENYVFERLPSEVRASARQSSFRETGAAVLVSAVMAVHFL